MEVDLSQLAVDRNPQPITLNRQRRWGSRYFLPAVMLFGFAGLVLWSAEGMIIPPRKVSVVPVLATQSEVRSEGTTLFNAAGWIEPRPTPIRVAALASGVINELLVVEDQTVKAGEPVASLVREDAELAYQRSVANRQLAEAELETARATFTAAKTRFEQPVHLQAMLAEADASLAKVNTLLKNLPFETRRAEAVLEFAVNDLRRNVSAGDSVSDREIDEAKTAQATANALLAELKDRKLSLASEATAIGQRREAIHIQLKLLADEIEAKDKAEAQIKAAEAQLKQMQVAEAEAKLRLDRMTIRAPVDGRVYRLIAFPGAKVGDGVMTAMAGHDGATVITMYRPRSLQIRVDVRFEDIPKVSLSQPVKIDNPALANPIKGHVLFVSSEADIQKNTLQVKVAIDDAPEFFKPEMLVDVTFLAPPKAFNNAEKNQPLRLFVPSQLVGQSETGSFVWLADQSEKTAKKIPVKTGLQDSKGLIEITSGLSVGSRVISSDTHGLEDGDRIKITGEGVVE